MVPPQLRLKPRRLPTMNTKAQALPIADYARFSLASLFEFMTVCGAVCATTPLIGAGACIACLCLTLALWLRQGLLALGLFPTAIFFAGLNLSENDAFGRQALALLVATAV